MKYYKLYMDIDIMDMLETENLNLLEFSNKINNLGKEENKKEFLKNYNDYKTVIENIDEYIEKMNKQNRSDNKINYENLELSELFKLLENIVSGPEQIKNKNLKELINIKKIIEIIEQKINSNNGHTFTSV